MFLNKKLSANYRQFIGNLFHQGKIVWDTSKPDGLPR